MCLPARLIAIVMLFLCSMLPAALASEIDSGSGSKRASDNGSSGTAPVFVLPQSGLATIAPEHLEFLEGYDHTQPIDKLRAATVAKERELAKSGQLEGSDPVTTCGLHGSQFADRLQPMGRKTSQSNSR